MEERAEAVLCRAIPWPYHAVMEARSAAGFKVADEGPVPHQAMLVMNHSTIEFGHRMLFGRVVRMIIISVKFWREGFNEQWVTKIHRS